MASLEVPSRDNTFKKNTKINSGKIGTNVMHPMRIPIPLHPIQLLQQSFAISFLSIGFYLMFLAYSLSSGKQGWWLVQILFKWEFKIVDQFSEILGRRVYIRPSERCNFLRSLKMTTSEWCAANETNKILL